MSFQYYADRAITLRSICHLPANQELYQRLTNGVPESMSDMSTGEETIARSELQRDAVFAFVLEIEKEIIGDAAVTDSKKIFEWTTREEGKSPDRYRWRTNAPERGIIGKLERPYPVDPKEIDRKGFVYASAIHGWASGLV